MSNMMDTEDLVGDQDLLENGGKGKATKQAPEKEKQGADELLSSMGGNCPFPLFPVLRN